MPVSVRYRIIGLTFMVGFFGLTDPLYFIIDFGLNMPSDDSDRDNMKYFIIFDYIFKCCASTLGLRKTWYYGLQYRDAFGVI